MTYIKNMVFFEMKNSLRAKWFYFYFVLFAGLMFGFIFSGVTASIAFGFTGLTRTLVTYIEVTTIILPLFILVSTARDLVMEKEFLIFEYIISYPISVADYFWGKFIGRFIIMVIPVFIAIIGAAIWAIANGLPVNWSIVLSYSILTISMSICFLGISYFISSIALRQDSAIFIAFFVWFFFLIFLDIGLLGIFLQFQVGANIILGIALSNPIELFRVAAFSLLNPKISVIGPIAWTLLGDLGNRGLLLIAYIYPFTFGLIFAYAGFAYFKESDYL